jgi:fumarate reductase flavoprotein subunit
MSGTMSRRSFVKGTAAGLGVVTAIGAPFGAERAAATQQSVRPSFETPPPPIPEKDIKATVTSDVVVVGAGIAGVIAALSAAESGASVALIEKAGSISARGGDNTAINSRLHEKVGITIDADKIIHDLMKVQGGRIHQHMLRLWARNSGKVMNWAMDIVAAEGLPSFLVIPAKETVVIDRWPNPTGMPPGWNPLDEYTTEYPTCHRIGEVEANQRRWLSIIEKNARGRGARIDFKTKAVRLSRNDPNGQVHAVIAQNADGRYTNYAATKGVILSTGDYGNNKEMVDAYFPGAGLQIGMIPTSLGEGHQMAMWIGAVMEKPPHAPLNDMTHAMGTNAFLLVNRHGERFCNEDLDTEAMARQAEEQNGCWLIIDASWPEDLPRMGLGFYRVHKDTPAIRKGFQDRVAKGRVLEAPTLDALAEKMKVPADALKKTISRYNELAKGRRDLDFGKRADRLTAVDTPPFYAEWTPNPDKPMLIFGGLLANERLQAVDADGKAISGLYLAGNTVGGRFKQAYPLLCPGISHGMAMTHAYLASKIILGLA